MAPPKKYPDELRERATRMAVEARRDPAAATGAIKRIAEQLGIHPEALRTWVKRAETDAGDRPGTSALRFIRTAKSCFDSGRVGAHARRPAEAERSR